jgi:predicted secreted protein with PEFG-CTERM motif
LGRAIFSGSAYVGFAVLLTLSTISPIFAQNDGNENQKFLMGVAKEHDENNSGFDIEYELEGNLSNLVIVNSTANSVTFEYDSKGIAEEELIIYLPMQLIEPPITVYVNGEEELESIRSNIGNITQMSIPLFESSKEITLVGAKVIPEFGSISVLILLLSVISIIVLTSTKKFQITFVK